MMTVTDNILSLSYIYFGPEISFNLFLLRRTLIAARQFPKIYFLAPATTTTSLYHKVRRLHSCQSISLGTLPILIFNYK